MLKEFREFAIKGNMVDMAVGVVIGTAFGRIITSLVNDVITPPLGVLAGSFDFSDYFINLSDTEYPSLAAAREAGAPVLAYGSFFTVCINFLIVAWVIFLVVRQINRLRRLIEPPAPPPPSNRKSCPYCVSEIPLAATRCPQCTSQLTPAASKA